MAAKQPFDVEEAIPLLREAVRPYPKAALFELAAEGHTSVFEILVACIISHPHPRRDDAAGRPPPVRRGPHPGRGGRPVGGARSTR